MWRPYSSLFNFGSQIELYLFGQLNAYNAKQTKKIIKRPISLMSAIKSLSLDMMKVLRLSLSIAIINSVLCFSRWIQNFGCFLFLYKWIEFNKFPNRMQITAAQMNCVDIYISVSWIVGWIMKQHNGVSCRDVLSKGREQTVFTLVFFFSSFIIVYHAVELFNWSLLYIVPNEKHSTHRMCTTLSDGAYHIRLLIELT